MKNAQIKFKKILNFAIVVIYGGYSILVLVTDYFLKFRFMIY